VDQAEHAYVVLSVTARPLCPPGVASASAEPAASGFGIRTRPFDCGCRPKKASLRFDHPGKVQ